MMAEIKLQYSLLCEIDEKSSFINIIHGFAPGQTSDFYVVNKWVWDEKGGEKPIPEDGYYQVTSILEEDNILVSSKSGPFRIKMAHTHHNHFQDIEFKSCYAYRVRVELFDSRHRNYTGGSLIYPLYTK